MEFSTIPPWGYASDDTLSPPPPPLSPPPLSSPMDLQGLITHQVNHLLTGFFPLIQSHIVTAVSTLDGKVNLMASFMDTLNAECKASITSICEQLQPQSEKDKQQLERDHFKAHLAHLEQQLADLHAQVQTINMAREGQDALTKSTMRRAQQIIVDFKTIEDRVDKCIARTAEHLNDRLGMVEGQFDTHACKFEELSIRCTALESNGRELVDHIAQNAATQSEACARRHRNR